MEKMELILLEHEEVYEGQWSMRRYMKDNKMKV